MKKLLPIFILAVLGIGSCDNYDSWTTDPSARLSFSQDTISFDTIITTVPSSTQRILAFNHNGSGIRISSVWLKKGADSHFRVNVDGEYLSDGQATDFEVHRSDSIYILAEVTLPETSDASIKVYTDSLCFQLESGQVQYVTLMAEGQNGEHHHGIFSINSDSTLRSDIPIIIYDSMYVASGATLTLNAGTRLFFHRNGQKGASLGVDGTLIVNGTVQEPVIFRGDRMDNMFSYLPYDNTPEQWGGVYLRGSSSNHKLHHLDMHASTTGLVAENTNILMDACIMYNSAGNALNARNSHIVAYNTQISNSYGDLYRMLGGSGVFSHCTLAQFNNYSSSRGYALEIRDYAVEYGDTMIYPIDSLIFNNSIITGYDDDVIMGYLRKAGEIYRFRNCYLSTDSMQQVNDTLHLHFFNNIFAVKQDSVSYGAIFTKFDEYARIYDFTPDSAARFRGIALPGYAAKYPKDRLGRQRPYRNADPGAYQCPKAYVPSESRKYRK